MRKPAANRWRRSASRGAREKIAMKSMFAVLFAALLLAAGLAQQHVGGAISGLEKAIDGKDHEAFVSAFDRLSAGCNACHSTLDHAFIVIQRPVLVPYSDQNFSAQ